MHIMPTCYDLVDEKRTSIVNKINVKNGTHSARLNHLTGANVSAPKIVLAVLYSCFGSRRTQNLCGDYSNK